ncbi:hypothetical protein L484_008972 [Morus notabilis]|uniref:Uncharacterized protein n=1 Tax=Morus notabilis TaxID=981085 RepID=W9SB16_9ROSA|nr:hypothetical protein L484_008972 [Morus notabilis]
MSMTASGKASKVQTKRQLTLLENALEGVFEQCALEDTSGEKLREDNVEVKETELKSAPKDRGRGPVQLMMRFHSFSSTGDDAATDRTIDRCVF